MSGPCRVIWCRIAGHSGRETIFAVDDAPNGVRTTRIVRESCLNCGRVTA